MINVVSGIMISAGLFFLLVSCLGIVRLPDFYTRNHAAGKSGTLGAILILGGLAIYNGWDVVSLKLLIILVFFFIGGPTATHAVARAAARHGLEIWTLNNRRPHNPEELAGDETDAGAAGESGK